MDPAPIFDMLAYLVLGTAILIALFLVIVLLRSTVWKRVLPSPLARLEGWLREYGIVLAFLVSLFSLVSSLFLSDVALFEPCLLCWWQRVFMFPLPILLGMILMKKMPDAAGIVLPLPLIGGTFSLYHWISQVTQSGTACRVVFDAAGASTSCSQAYLMYFGFLSIPFMTLTAFLLIAIFLFMGRKT